MPYRTPPRTQVVAHRGNSGPLPENTRIAIESAIDVGVDMVEVDVRMTKDGVLVLMHSAAVDRTTSGTGLSFSEDLDGEFVMEPGTVFGIDGMSQNTSTDLWQLGVTWYEDPI